ncbi:glycosyltransferase family 4 protein [Polaromonas sp. YR568]|uniref:glycosyltransferase family 4 protein n=1 Tax=Polaromonas sp. YR568 TaxID=1855301 RepID=UPI003137D10B
MVMTSSARSAPAPLHLVGRFEVPYSGACLELLAMRDQLATRRPVECWSVTPPHALYARQGVKAIRPFASQFPRGGVLYWGGAHVPPDVWLKYARFDRVMLHVNLASYARLFALFAILHDTTSIEPELVFVSESLRLTAGLQGQVLYSPINTEPLLSIADTRWDGDGRRLPVTVGRVSRDVLDKHHPQDPWIYRMLVAAGHSVRIMGGTCLASELGDVEGVELLPEGSQPVADFYKSLDIFFYRTGSTVEAYGRVVAEAMATGLPVVAENRGGYVEVIDPGVTGCLVQSQEQAWDTLEALATDVALRRRIGVAASADIRRFHGAEALSASLDRLEL